MRSHTGSGPSLARVREVQNVVLRLQDWAARRDGVLAVALVGSYAYGAPRLDSDVDVVIVCSDVSALSGDPTSLAAVAPDAQVIRRAQWGVLSERRVRLGSGLEVELGFVAESWLAAPLDPGTQRVLSDGCQVVADDGRLTAALKSLGQPVKWWSLSAAR